MRSASNNVWTIVVEDAEGSLVACGSIFVELKFTHECGKVGHIEDIVVSRCACERCRPAIHLRDIS
jgi:glucosamine-phosphate N-acetyltransferase